MGWQRKRVARDQAQKGPQHTTQQTKQEVQVSERMRPEATSAMSDLLLLDPRLAHPANVGQRAGLLRAGQQAQGNLALQHLLQGTPPAAQTALVQRRPAGRSGSAWSETVSKAKDALYTDPRSAARYMRQAVLLAAAKAAIPAGLEPKIRPKTEDIQVDPKMKAEAITSYKEVPRNEGNYWRWIRFGPGCLEQTQAFTESVITHELVHVRQYQKIWQAYKRSGRKISWNDFRKPYDRTARGKGPVELQADLSILEYLNRLTSDELKQVLRKLYASYIHTATYKPKPGDPVAPITTTQARQTILAYFAQTTPALQERMGDLLWSILMIEDPPKEQWHSIVKELRPIALKGYNSMLPGQRRSMNRFLAGKKLTLAKLLKK